MTRSTLRATAFVFVTLSGSAPSGHAQSLFHPAPREGLRDLRTDRPDRTESPFTVDPGYVQIEVDLVAWSRDRFDAGTGRVEDRSLTGLSLLVKFGLTPRVDLQLGASGVTRWTSGEVGGPRLGHTSVGEVLTSRIKINLWGNDAGPTAFGLLPYVALEKPGDGGGGRRVHAGLILPLAVDPGGGWGLGFMLEADALTEGPDDRYGLVAASATAGRSIGAGFGGYVEVYAARSFSGGPGTEVTGDVGVTRSIGRNLQLDAGTVIGLSEAAQGVGLFLGTAVRF